MVLPVNQIRIIAEIGSLKLLGTYVEYILREFSQNLVPEFLFHSTHSFLQLSRSYSLHRVRDHSFSSMFDH